MSVCFFFFYPFPLSLLFVFWAAHILFSDIFFSFICDITYPHAFLSSSSSSYHPFNQQFSIQQSLHPITSHIMSLSLSYHICPFSWSSMSFPFIVFHLHILWSKLLQSLLGSWSYLVFENMITFARYLKNDPPSLSPILDCSGREYEAVFIPCSYLQAPLIIPLFSSNLLTQPLGNRRRISIWRWCGF